MVSIIFNLFKGIYNMEPLKNLHWGFLSIGFMRLYHYLILQPISFATEVNLNSIMCPAVSDPFEGPYYRIAAHVHQTFFILLHGKFYCLLGRKFFFPKLNEINQNINELNQNSKKFLTDANGNNLNSIQNNSNCCNNSAKFNQNDLSNIKED